MDILQSNECFYNETNAASTTFNATLIIHILFLFELISIFLLILYIYLELFFWYGALYGSVYVYII